MRRFIVALLVVLAIASVTHGPVQELCATVAYLGIGAAAVALYVERRRERRRGE
jgi:hypothetical protein